ncbi:uncharacterized protein LOC129737762 [Uranotaenia lowii]|uniref:uncharacterized protein LOC129737762 n=1 Tax=Uranotaenia lowii TaxID=190385 RepID=UPI002479A389|nr:uncharacterized protein LOC129737762 [Uranotaenia lowii]
MSEVGKFVKAPITPNVCEKPIKENKMAEVGRYVRAPTVQEPVYEEYFDLGGSENATETPVQGNADFAKRLDEFGQLLQSLIEKSVRSENQQPLFVDNDWGRNTEQPAPLQDEASAPPSAAAPPAARAPQSPAGIKDSISRSETIISTELRILSMSALECEAFSPRTA